jgi:hypothetical protein
MSLEASISFRLCLRDFQGIPLRDEIESFGAKGLPRGGLQDGCLSHVGSLGVATQDRVFPYYVPNSSIKHSKSDSKDRSQEIL